MCRFPLRALAGGLALACLAAGTIAAQSSAAGNPEAAKLKNPVPATADSIAAGKKVYQRYCLACHGPDGKGGPSNREEAPPASDLTDAKWDHGSSDGEIYYVIKNGVQPDLFMESWEGRIAEPDIWNLVNYVKSLAPRK
jgi:copper transport protein